MSASYFADQSTPTIDYLIITSNSMLEAVEPLADWKTQRGLYAAIRTVEDIANQYPGVDLAEKVRNCIIDYYENKSTNWVVLAGGEYIVPTRTVVVDDNYISCDSYYANLDNNWNLLSGVIAEDRLVELIDINNWEPEVYVGRLSADTEAQMEDLVTRLIDYERSPPIGPWMKTAIFAGTFARFDCDVNGNNILDENDIRAFDTNRNHNWLSENIFPSDWNCIHLGETEGVQTTQYHYDGSINESTLTDYVNSGASIVMTDSHGGYTSTIRTIFAGDEDEDGLFDWNYDDMEEEVFLSTSTPFNTEGKLGLYFIAACSTGTFVDRYCLTEYITRTSGIGCIGSSNSAYYDSGWYDGETLGWYTQGLSERFWRQVFEEDGNHPGKALALAKERYGNDYVLLEPDAYDWGRTCTQYNLMGDPEVPLWLDIPSSLTISINPDNASRIVTVLVKSENSPLANALVTMVGDSIYQKALTDSDGEVHLAMPSVENVTEVTITASLNGYVPAEMNTSIPPNGNLIDMNIVVPIAVIGAIAIAALIVYTKKKV